MLNTDDRSSHNELPKLRSREKAQSGVLKAANALTPGQVRLIYLHCSVYC